MFYTKRLMLRGWDADADLNKLHNLVNDESITRWWLISPQYRSREAVAQHIQDWNSKKSRLQHFAVCERPAQLSRELPDGDDNLLVTKDGQPRYPIIGVLNLFEPFTRDPYRLASIGVLLDRQHLGMSRVLQQALDLVIYVLTSVDMSIDQGLGSEMIEWACAHLFNSLNMHKIEIEVHAANVRSRHVFEKLGFEVEGVRKSCYWYDGKWDDILWMGLTEDRWREIKSNREEAG